MRSKAYLYVDGESHYIRTEAMAKSYYGVKSLSEIALTSSYAGGPLLFDDKMHFFWIANNYDIASQLIDRKMYFTSFTGQDSDLLQKKLLLRMHGFDPNIIKEEKDDRNKRESRLRDGAVIEKAKGVDILLSVTMLEDASRDNFDQCILFTSDSDYLPVIKFVRNMGKRVSVYGYKDYLGNSEMEYFPDSFIDLGHYFRQGHLTLLKK